MKKKLPKGEKGQQTFGPPASGFPPKVTFAKLSERQFF